MSFWSSVLGSKKKGKASVGRMSSGAASIPVKPIVKVPAVAASAPLDGSSGAHSTAPVVSPAAAPPVFGAAASAAGAPSDNSSAVSVAPTVSGADSTSPPAGRALTLDEELEQAWDYTQRKLYCQDLPYPKIEDDLRCRTAYITMSNQQISIDRRFLESLKARGVDYQTALRGLLLHEAGHFKILPWDLKNSIMLLYCASKVSPEKKDSIKNYFEDVCVNLDITLRKGEDSIRRLYNALDSKEPIDALMKNLYGLKTGLDFNAPHINKDLQYKLNELGKIKFTSKKDVYDNLTKFAWIVKDVVESDKEREKKREEEEKEEERKEKDKNNNAKRSNDQGSDGGKGEGSEGGDNKKYTGPGENGFDLKSYDRGEVERVLKEIAGDINDPGNFNELYSFVKEEMDKGKGKDGKKAAPDEKNKSGLAGILSTGPGSGISMGREATEALIQFYTAKAERYEVTVEDKDVLGGGDNSKTELKGWEVDDPYSSVDIFNSYGKFFPDISKSWKESGDCGEKKTNSTPDLLVMVDSSSSMPDPNEELSFAVLGGLCAARQYLKKGSRVAVANFGDDTIITGFTKDYDKMMEGLAFYQSGGTELFTDKIYDLISKNQRPVDILLLSDGVIWNYDNIMKELISRKNTNRVTIAEVTRGNMLGGFSFDSSRFEDEKINVYKIMDADDVPNIIIGDMQERGV